MSETYSGTWDGTIGTIGIFAGCMSHLPSARGRVVSALPLPRELALGPPGVFEEGEMTEMTVRLELFGA
jgi:hypothetical protein